MNYCSQCGAEVHVTVPAGDHLPRHVCPACGTIHYQNPKIVTGCIPEWEDRILLCRRAIEPRLGLWTLPAGFMENGESTAQGAARETREETGAEVRIRALYSSFSLPHISQVYMLFRGELLAPDGFGPTPESLEVALFREQDVPWEEIAFSVVVQTLRLYFEDRRNGFPHTHVGTIERVPGERRDYRITML